MKKELEVMSKFVVGFAWMVITFWSCTDDPGKTGLDLLPHNDLVVVSMIKDANIKAYNVTDVKQRTDETTYNLLGTFNDPVFGKTTADFAYQFRLGSFPKFKENDIIDSLVLVMGYKDIYGDTLTPQKLKIYELASDLSLDDKYYQDTNLKSLAKSEVLAEMNYVPRFKDTLQSSTSTVKDTVTHEIDFHLDPSLARYLMKADSATTLSSNDDFIKYFKGLYVEAGDLNQGGTIMKILGSAMVLYFRKENDTTKYSYVFNVNKNAAKVSRFAHDYSNTVFAASLDQDKQDSLLYLQTSGGLRAKIFIPNLGVWTKLIPSLAGNSDTANLIINKAELVFQVDSTISDPDKYPLPGQLILAAIAKSKSNQDSIYYPSDYTFYPTYFGGGYTSKDKTYRFNIAKQMQDVIEKKKENLGFYLETVYKNETYRRVVLKGATSKTGIRLEVTYSKIR